MSAYRTVKSEAVDSEFLENLLLDMVAEPAKPNPRKRKGPPSRRETDYASYRDNQGASSDGADDPPEPKFSRRREALSSDDEALITPIKRFKSESGAGINIHHTTSQVDQLRMDDDPYDEMENDYAPIDLDGIDEYLVKKEEGPTVLTKSSSNGHPFMVKNESKVETGPPSWLAVHASLPVAATDTVGGGSSNLASSRVQALEEDGTLRMFWLDYLEVESKIYLVGKDLDKPTNKYVSACVAIENIERNLFVLPRERRMEGDYETDIQPEKRDVQADFTEARQRFDIKRCAMKWVKRKYAFGEPGIPTQETLWMKVVYPFSGSRLLL